MRPIAFFCTVCFCLSSTAFAQSSTIRLTVPIVPEVYSDGGSVAYPALSPDGTIAMFLSPSSKLVPGDTNRSGAVVGTDVFIRDIAAQTTRRIMGVGGVQPNGDASYAAMTSDARYVFFVSTATNLVANDPNGSVPSVFRHDLQTGATVLLADVLTNFFSISGDGRFIVYRQGSTDYIRDLTTNVAIAFDAGVINPTLNADGSIVAFEGTLVPGFAFNGFVQIFVRDRSRGVYELISKRPDGQGANGTSGSPVMSADGRYVAFQSSASNLVANDTNGVVDIFVHDRTTGQTTRVSLSATGTQRTSASFAPAISGDGAVVAFAPSPAAVCDTAGCPMVAEVAVYDRNHSIVEVVSVSSDGTPANSPSVGTPFALDHTGRRVAFASAASSLTPLDTNEGSDLFLRDRGPSPTCTYEVSPSAVDVSAAGGTAPVTVTTTAACAWVPTSVSPWVTVPSAPAAGPGTVTLTMGANTGVARFGYIAVEGRRVLIRQPGALTTTPPSIEHVSLSPDGSVFTDGGFAGSISADGRLVAFTGSMQPRLPSGDSLVRVYLRDRASGITTDVSNAPGGPADITMQRHSLHGVGSHEGAVLVGWGNVLSTDGRFVYFSAYDFRTSTVTGCFVFDRDSGRSSALPSGLGFSSFGCPAMNATGRFFAGALFTVNNTVLTTVVFYDRVTQQRTEFTFPGLGQTDKIQNIAPSVNGRLLIAHILTGCQIGGCFSQYSVILDRTTGATARTAVVDRTLNGDRLMVRLRAQLVDQAWMEFGLPRFHTRLDEAFTGCEIVDRQTGQRTALPGLRAAQAFSFECGIAVNNGRQILFSTPLSFSPGDIYADTPDLHVYTIADGAISRIGTGAGGVRYPITAVSAVSQNGRYVLGSSREPHVGSPFVFRAVVFDLGVGADPVDNTTPTNLLATVTGSIVALSWTAPGQGTPTSYLIEAGSSPGASNLAVVETGSTATSLTTPAPPGTYFVRVRARVGGSLTGASNEVTLTVPGGCTQPGVPSGLTHSVTGTAVMLTWQAASGATRYVLEAGSSSGASNLVSVDTGTASTTFNATAPPGTFYVRVRARNSCGTSPPSNETVVVVGGGCPLPVAPANLTGSVSGRNVSLAWVAPSGSITGYVLEAGTASGLSNVVQVDLGPGTSLSAVAPPGTYFVRIRARNACGLGPATNEVTLTIN